jgi:hypothetical protein
MHSTTGEIPASASKGRMPVITTDLRLAQVIHLPDGFACFPAVDGYRPFLPIEIEVPKVPLREDVELHLIPDTAKAAMEIRIWWDKKMVHSVSYPLIGFRLHL